MNLRHVLATSVDRVCQHILLQFLHVSEFCYMFMGILHVVCSPVLVEFFSNCKCFWHTVETLVKLKTYSFLLFRTNNVGMCTVEPLLKNT